MSAKKIVLKVIPEYAILPLAGVVGLNWIAYFGTRLIPKGIPYHDFSTSLDAWIPFEPMFIVFYIGAFLQWGICYILIGRESRAFCYRYTLGDCIAKFCCLLCFLFLPTHMIRPEVTGTDVFSHLLGLIYSVDAPDNLFPSIHCLESWICLRAVNQMEWVGFKWKILNHMMTLGVFLSTLICKQHLVVDVLAGVLVVELGLIISDFFFNHIRKDIILNES